MPFTVGSIIEGKVKSIAPFGAFVEVSSGSVGLVHISEIDTNYVQDINQHLKIGQQVRVKVISDENGKLNLSIKKVIEEDRKHTKRPADVDWGSKNKNSKLSFEDMLSKFKQESDEKISVMKTTRDTKRSRNTTPY